MSEPSSSTQVALRSSTELVVQAPEISDIPTVSQCRQRMDNATLMHNVIFADSPADIPADATSTVDIAYLTCFDPCDARSRVAIDLAQQSDGHVSLPHVVDVVRRAMAVQMQSQSKGGQRGGAPKRVPRPPFLVQTEFLVAKEAETSLAGTCDYRNMGQSSDAAPMNPAAEKRYVTVADVPTCPEDEYVPASTDAPVALRSRAYAKLLEFSERWDEFSVLLLAIAPSPSAKAPSVALWQLLRAALSRSPYLDEPRVTACLKHVDDPAASDPTTPVGDAMLPYLGHGVPASVILARCTESIAKIRANLAAVKKPSEVNKAYADFRQGGACDSSLFRGVHGWILRAAARAVITEGSNADLPNPIRTSSYKVSRTGRYLTQFKSTVFLPKAGPAAATQFDTSGAWSPPLAMLYSRQSTPAFEAEKAAMKELAIGGGKYLTMPPAIRFFDGVEMRTQVGGNPIRPCSIVSVVFHPKLSMMPGCLNSSFVVFAAVVLRWPENVSDMTRSEFERFGSDSNEEQPDTRFFGSVGPSLRRPALIRAMPDHNYPTLACDDGDGLSAKRGRDEGEEDTEGQATKRRRMDE